MTNRIVIALAAICIGAGSANALPPCPKQIATSGGGGGGGSFIGQPFCSNGKWYRITSCDGPSKPCTPTGYMSPDGIHSVPTGFACTTGTCESEEIKDWRNY